MIFSFNGVALNELFYNGVICLSKVCHFMESLLINNGVICYFHLMGSLLMNFFITRDLS